MGINKQTPKANDPDALVKELRSRKWPEEVTGAIIGDYDRSPYVREGRVFSRALRLHQNVSAPITPGESGVTSLCTATNGKIYGATSGKRCHLFFYDPSPLADGVVDCGTLEGVSSARRTVVAAHDNRVFIGATETSDGKGGALFVHHTGEDHLDEFRSIVGPTEKLAVPVKGEGIGALCCDPDRRMIYGVSAETGTFFRYSYDVGKMRLYGSVSKDHVFSKCLVLDAAGNVYGTHSLGTLYRYSPGADRLEDLNIRIPGVAGREFYNQLDSAVFEPGTGAIYGAGTADGVIFSLNPETLSFRTIGKVIAEPRVRAMAISGGRVYGVSGNEDGMGHLFCYDPQEYELRDLGIMQAVSEVWRRGFEFDAACTGQNGEIYFGENEWEGHLFMYFPPTKQPRTPEWDVPF